MGSPAPLSGRFLVLGFGLGLGGPGHFEGSLGAHTVDVGEPLLDEFPDGSLALGGDEVLACSPVSAAGDSSPVGDEAVIPLVWGFDEDSALALHDLDLGESLGVLEPLKNLVGEGAQTEVTDHLADLANLDDVAFLGGHAGVVGEDVTGSASFFADPVVESLAAVGADPELHADAVNQLLAAGTAVGFEQLALNGRFVSHGRRFLWWWFLT